MVLVYTAYNTKKLTLHQSRVRIAFVRKILAPKHPEKYSLSNCYYEFYSYLQPFGRARQLKYGLNGPGKKVGRYSADPAQNRLIGKSDPNFSGVCFVTFIHISNRLAVLANCNMGRMGRVKTSADIRPIRPKIGSPERATPTLGDMFCDFYSYLQRFGHARQLKYGPNGAGKRVGRYSDDPAQNRLIR